MSRSELPLKVLSLLGPILSWVEGSAATAVPEAWKDKISNDNIRSLAFQSDNQLISSLQQRAWLLHELPTYSLDNVDEIMALSGRPKPSMPDSALWLPLNKQLNPPTDYNLINVFHQLAQRYLCWNGSEVVIKGKHVIELHALGLRMPLSFMVQHFYACSVASGEKKLEDVSALIESINLLSSNSRSISNVINKGLSEGHLHLNSIHATENSWADHLLLPIDTRPKQFSVVDWRLLRFGRAVARTLALATTLVRANIEISAQDGIAIHNALDNMYCAKDLSSMEEFERQHQIYFDNIVQDPKFFGDLSSVDNLPDGEFFSDGFSRRKVKGQRFGLFYWLDPWRQTNWPVFNDNSKYPKLNNSNKRRRFISNLHLVSHLALLQTPPITHTCDNSHDQHDTKNHATGRFLHRSLFRYLIAQTHHWQQAVQQGRTTGLRNFKVYFDSNQRNPIEPTVRENAEAVFKQISHWQGLDVLEGRVSPPRIPAKDLLPWIQEFVRKIKNGNKIKKFGLVIHFIKDEEPKSHRDDSSIRLARYGLLRKRYRSEAFHLYHILKKSSVENPFIVGIDAANLELATPPEVFAPIFRFLRDEPIEILRPQRFDSNFGDNKKLHLAIKHLVRHRHLGMTYHVGEEFRHILSGLRAIDEVLEFLNPRSGDRIGHGIALGLEPKVWLEQTGYQALMPKQEWLDTLVWIFHYLGSGDEQVKSLNIEYEIERLAREIYQHGGEDSKNSINPHLLWNAWLLRQLDPGSIYLDEKLNSFQFQPLTGVDAEAWRWNRITNKIVNEINEKVGNNPPSKLLSQYWCDAKVRAAGNKLCLIDMEDESENWLEICRKAQKIMQNRVIKRQMVVEVNPSSNFSIGSMSRFTEHPIFNMVFDHEGNWQRRLRVTINTDNPGTANTSLSHEYYLLGEALMGMGRPESEVLEWLEWLRQCGEESSFVRHLPEIEHWAMKTVVAEIRKTFPGKDGIFKWYKSENK